MRICIVCVCVCVFVCLCVPTLFNQYVFRVGVLHMSVGFHQRSSNGNIPVVVDSASAPFPLKDCCFILKVNKKDQQQGNKKSVRI